MSEGLWGVVIGALVTIAATFIQHWLQQGRAEKVAKKRRALLKKMLKNPPPGTEWRTIEKLSQVTGAGREETTSLLIEVGARGSEGEKDVWALESKKPLGVHRG